MTLTENDTTCSLRNSFNLLTDHHGFVAFRFRGGQKAAFGGEKQEEEVLESSGFFFGRKFSARDFAAFVDSQKSKAEQKQRQTRQQPTTSTTTFAAVDRFVLSTQQRQQQPFVPFRRSRRRRRKSPANRLGLGQPRTRAEFRSVSFRGKAQIQVDVGRIRSKMIEKQRKKGSLLIMMTIILANFVISFVLLLFRLYLKFFGKKLRRRHFYEPLIFCRF